MRILLLARQPLSPLEDGLNLRVHHLFQELARRHSISLICLDEHAGETRTGRESRIPFVASRSIPIQPDGAGLVHECSPEVERVIREFLESTPADVVVASTISMVPYAQRIQTHPVVVDLVDSLSLLVYRDMRKEPRLLQKLRLVKKWWWYRRFENREFKRLGNFVLVSQADAAVVKSRAPRANVAVIPNGVDADYFRPSAVQGESLELVFSGVMGFPPNTRAVTYFCSKVLPRIREVFPDVSFTIAGKWPPQELYQLTREDPRVTITGFVPDIRPYLNRASVYVAPMVSGSGIKNKILEAWAVAKPVVATPISCGGLAVSPGETLLVARGPEAFARAVIRLLRDPGLRERIGRQARKHVLAHYTWQRQARRLEELLERVTDPWGRVPARGDQALGQPQ